MRWSGRGPAWAAVVLLTAAVTTSCTAAPGGRVCTEIGSPAGLAVTVERDLVAAPLTLTLRACQDACTEQPVSLQAGSVSVGQTCSPDTPDGSCSASSSPDGTLVGFLDLPELVAGPVRVAGSLRSAAADTTFDEVELTAEPTYPNGPDCPAGGPQAAVRVTSTGLR